MERKHPSEKKQSVRKPKLAAALHYNQEQDHAPRLIAFGKGNIAEQILEIAQEHEIPLHQDSGLAELLGTIELGSEIPEETYTVVAEILAFVYRLSQSK